MNKKECRPKTERWALVISIIALVSSVAVPILLDYKQEIERRQALQGQLIAKSSELLAILSSFQWKAREIEIRARTTQSSADLIENAKFIDQAIERHLNAVQPMYDKLKSSAEPLPMEILAEYDGIIQDEKAWPLGKERELLSIEKIYNILDSIPAEN